jgi:hypothetical protein
MKKKVTKKKKKAVKKLKSPAVILEVMGSKMIPVAFGVVPRVRVRLSHRLYGAGYFTAEQHLCEKGLLRARIVPGRRYKLVAIRSGLGM